MKTFTQYLESMVPQSHADAAGLSYNPAPAFPEDDYSEPVEAIRDDADAFEVKKRQQVTDRLMKLLPGLQYHEAEELFYKYSKKRTPLEPYTDAQKSDFADDRAARQRLQAMEEPSGMQNPSKPKTKMAINGPLPAMSHRNWLSGKPEFRTGATTPFFSARKKV